METQINNSLILIGAFALLAISGLFKLLLELIRSGKTYVVQAPSLGMGQRGGQGLNLSPFVIAAVIIIIVLAFNFDRIRSGNAAAPNGTGQSARVTTNDTVPTKSDASNTASNEQERAFQVLNDFLVWRANALLTRQRNGVQRFLTANARERMAQSLALLQAENCHWKTRIESITLIDVRTISSGTMQQSVSFNLYGRLYCNGQLDPRSILNPVRVGATVDFSQVNGQWLVKDSSALEQLTGNIATAQQ